MRLLATIIETPAFRRQIDTLLTDTEHGELMAALAADPLAGDLIQGTGGIRVVYLYIHDQAPIYAFVAYGKNERTNLSKAERNAAAALAADYKAQHRKEAP